MFESLLVIAIVLLLATIVLTVISNRLGISAPIFLVIAGLVISLMPGIPHLRLDPDLLFVILLPPLLYRAAWNTNWNDFWSNRRPISLHGLGLVIATAVGIAYLSHALIPNFSLAQGFLLGSIVAPPDALAATSVLQQLKIRQRIVTILEGESLINDAASLIVFRFALAAVVSGQFSFWEASADFLLASCVGISIGCGIAGLMYLLQRFVPTSPSMDTVLSIAAPYVMYLCAEKADASGILAVVSGGFVSAYYASKTLTPQAKLQIQGVWETLVFILNGFVFILIGLQLPIIISKLKWIPLPVAIGFGLAISVAVVLIRMVWVFPATYLPRLLNPRLRANDPYPGWRAVFLLGWCGMRGVVTLASALTIPLLLNDQRVFPFRTLIIFIAFTVIIFTLIVQGLSLPYLTRYLALNEPDNDENQLTDLTNRLTDRVLDHLLNHYSENVLTHEMREQLAQKTLIIQTDTEIVVSESGTPQQYQQLKREIITIRREELARLRRQNAFSEAIIRQKEFELDLEQIALS
ncbi:Na+/H+ antiporter [Spirosoma validum]|uniref:Na+/H+ antiporter n=1 Tax=Spirosoma validum TaxID=2771355 RepID=A0A927AXI1_9BACT|nr:Na+/H+ antiporter [Spirosoma validum]MBD2751654.1 Na+/H+ antiporter [Spirosoma validum]